MNTNIKILLCDDSSFMRKVLKDILEKAGFKTFVEAGTGTEAIAKYESEKPDLVLLDIMMPEASGIEVLQKIGSTATAIVISAIGQDTMIDDAKKNGAKGYIIKPFENDKVLEEIKRVMGA